MNLFGLWTIPSSIQAGILRYLLKRTFGRLLHNFHAINIQADQGNFSLTNVQLNIATLNELLEIFLPGLKIVAGTINSISATINWNSIFSGTSQITIDNIVLKVQPKDLAESVFYDAIPLNDVEESVYLEFSSLFIAQEMLNNKDICADFFTNENEELASLAFLIDKIIASVEVHCTNLSIIISEYLPNCSSQILVQCKDIKLWDDSEAFKSNLDMSIPNDHSPTAVNTHDFIPNIHKNNTNHIPDGTLHILPLLKKASLGNFSITLSDNLDSKVMLAVANDHTGQYDDPEHDQLVLLTMSIDENRLCKDLLVQVNSMIITLDMQSIEILSSLTQSLEPAYANKRSVAQQSYPNTSLQVNIAQLNLLFNTETTVFSAILPNISIDFKSLLSIKVFDQFYISIGNLHPNQPPSTTIPVLSIFPKTGGQEPLLTFNPASKILSIEFDQLHILALERIFAVFPATTISTVPPTYNLVLSAAISLLRIDYYDPDILASLSLDIHTLNLQRNTQSCWSVHFDSASLSSISADSKIAHCLVDISNGMLIKKIISRDQTSHPANATNILSDKQFWPFSQVYQMVEGDRFVAVAEADEAKETQEQLELQSDSLLQLSFREVEFFITADCIMLLNSLKKRLILPNAASSENVNCMTIVKCLCKKVLCKYSDNFACNLNELAIFTLFANSSVKLVDIRCNLEDLHYRSSIRLMEKVVTASLDGSKKSISSTFSLTESNIIGSLQLLGLKLNIPLTDLDMLRQDIIKEIDGHPFVDTQATKRSVQFYLVLDKFSLFPMVPSKWVTCPPHAIYIEKIFLFPSISTLPTLLSGHIVKLSLLAAANRKSLRAPSGLYEDGMVFWNEQGYVQIGNFDYAHFLAQNNDSYCVVSVENQKLQLYLCQDSLRIVKNIISFYTVMFTNQKKNEAKKISTQNPTFDSMHLKESLEDTNWIKSPPSTAPNYHRHPPLPILIDEDGLRDGFSKSFDSGDFSKLQPIEEVIMSITDDWEVLIECPVNHQKTEENNPSKDDPKILGESNGRKDLPLNFDGEHFSNPEHQKDTFPFSSLQTANDLAFKIKFVELGLKIMLLEGRHFESIEGKKFLDSFISSSPSTELPNISINSSLDDGTGSSEMYRQPISERLSTSDYPLYTTSSKWHFSNNNWTQNISTNTSNLNQSVTILKEDQNCVEIDFIQINCEVDISRLDDAVIKDDCSVKKNENQFLYISALRCTIKDLMVLDKVKSSKWNKIVACQDERGNGPYAMINLSSYLVGPVDDRVEYGLKIKIVPTRISIDQNTITFLSTSFSADPAAYGLEPSINDECLAEETAWFFQSFKISEINLKLDYKPRKIDFRKLQIGKYYELLNLFAVENAQINLPPVHLCGLRGIYSIGLGLLDSWLPAVRDTQIPNMITGITPIRTVVNVGGSMADLVLLPLQQYKKDGQVLRGVCKGVTSFTCATSTEGIRIGAKLAKTSLSIAENIDKLFLDENEAGESSRNPTERKMSLSNAYTCLAKDVNIAMQTIIAIPVQVYGKSGPGGAAKAILKAVPIAVIRPVLGTTRALATTIVGLENLLSEEGTDNVK